MPSPSRSSSRAKPQLFEHLSELLGDKAQLERMMETAPLYGANDRRKRPPKPKLGRRPRPIRGPRSFGSGRPANCATNWTSCARNSKARTRVWLAQAGANAKVKQLESEIEKAKKRETKKAEQFAKKLEQVEAKWAAKYEELNKLEAREERRVRKLQAQIEALETDNKRSKRQVRQGAQLREDERRKNIGLQAQLDELRGEVKDEKPAAKKADGRGFVAADNAGRAQPSGQGFQAVAARRDF